MANSKRTDGGESHSEHAESSTDSDNAKSSADSEHAESKADLDRAESSTDSAASTRSVEARRIPSEVADRLGRLFGTEDRPETFGAWTDEIAETFDDDWPPDVDLLCHDDEGLHRAETADRTYRFTCVLDAFLLPFLTDEAVEVRSVDPLTGDEIAASVSRDGIETDPEAVLSFGVAVRESDADAEPTPERLYGALCPYIHAFADRETYAEWAAETDGATTAMALSDGFELARALVRA